jgi:indolepyruvate ferredoxin oxidoreductase
MSVPAAALAPSIDREYTLEHKYTRTEGPHLPVRRAGPGPPAADAADARSVPPALNTGGFISGYRGSPLGGFDLELWKAKKHLKTSGIEFQPGLNEDLGATMVWGTQQANLFPGAKYDGVFAMWYGKGPGVDRCGDVFKHGNAAGTSATAACWRSRPTTTPAAPRPCRTARNSIRQRDDAGAQSGRRAGHPRHGPARLGDVALHRALGRLQDDRRDGRVLGQRRTSIRISSTSSLPTTSRCRPAASTSAGPIRRSNQEMRLHQYAVQASQAFARANRIDRVVIDSPKRASASSPPARAISTCCRRSNTWASVRRWRRRRHPRLQGRHDLAAGAGGHPRLRARPRGHHRRRGEALLHRDRR